MEKSPLKKEELLLKNWLLLQNEQPDHYSTEISLEYYLKIQKKKTELFIIILIQKRKSVAE
jgi:hypothetical protein